ncbi:MAG: DNA translocase FtsK 4TM domain-containing protein [Bacteroidetes bacterium]|nr:DNA translocase FtsK 4TM domain-containing protein [Bacteroidota bacterium]
MEDNEFIPKSEQKQTDSTPKAKTKKEDKKEISVTNTDKVSFFEKIDKQKLKVVFGSFLSLLSIYIFLACVSYLFTWDVDQDKILNRSFVDFLFDSNTPAVENWLGKFGAWSSHMLIYETFGLTSFGICFLMFISGFKILFDVALFPIVRSFMVVFSYMLWGSLFLGFFASNVNYLGGTFGFYLVEWLVLALGQLGTISLIIATFFVITTLLFSPNYKAIISYLFATNEKEVALADESLVNDVQGYDDIHVVNPIREDQIQEDILSEPVEFSKNDYDVEDDDYGDFDESELIVTIKEEKNELETQPNSDFEFEIGGDEKDIINEANLNSTPISEKLKGDDDLAEGLVAEYGEYDPTKDLEGYMLPPIELMKDYGTNGVSVNKEEIESNKDRIVQTLSHYKIDIAKIKATIGPTVTLYEIVPAPGVRISKIKNLEDDIALSLSALGIRIIAPIPGKGTIGIEVPNSNPEMVSMRSLIASEKFQNFDGELPVVMGKTITNETFVFDLTKMPHLLVAGSTGQGKSVGLNAILISILYKKHPAQVKFVLVDPKKVELTLYNKIERHFLAKLPGEEDAIITDTSKVVNTLNSLCIEMDERYELLKDAGVRMIKEYNAKFIARRLNPEKGHRYLPYIVVLIDEFADLIMTAGKEVEHPIARIAQLARAIGIHLIVATQRPSVNVITGMIKANFPARIAFRVLSKIDSRTILDASGADQLIGRGDMLISTGSDMKRLQCGFVDTPEVEEICSFIGDQRAYPEALILPEYIPEGSEGGSDFDMNEIDVMFVDSARIVVINQQGSASLLQRKLKLGYNRAGRIVDQLEGMGIIGPFQGSKAREVLFSDVESLDEFMRTKGLL